MDGKTLLASLMGIGLAIAAVSHIDEYQKKSDITENFWGTQLTFKTMPVLQKADGQQVAYGGSLVPSMLGNSKFVSTPSFQATLSPRFSSNLQYGANIRYNPPDRENLGVNNCDPLGYGDMAKENYARPSAAAANNNNNNNKQAASGKAAPGIRAATAVKEPYCGGCSNPSTDSTVSCGKGGYGLGHQIGDDGQQVPPGYHNGNYKDAYDSLPSSGAITHEIPVGAMSSVDGGGNVQQVVAMQRLMFAPQRSRLRANNDMIRGSLPIQHCESNWFSVHPNYANDLQAGAFNVLAGVGAPASVELNNLILQSSGGTKTALGGVNLQDELPKYNVNMHAQAMTNLSQGTSMLNVQAFP